MEDENIAKSQELPVEIAASVIKKNIEEAELKAAYQIIEGVGMLEEFKKFISNSEPMHIYDAMREFGKLHPDKFYVLNKEESYDEFIDLRTENEIMSDDGCR